MNFKTSSCSLSDEEGGGYLYLNVQPLGGFLLDYNFQIILAVTAVPQ